LNPSIYQVFPVAGLLVPSSHYCPLVLDYFGNAILLHETMKPVQPSPVVSFLRRIPTPIALAI
ncbi:hypothetical protein RSAG8_13843, partial [Rhizoctonia solani AG-8 WAC10335]